VAGALKWVAVAGWQWCRWIEESSAVRMVLVRTWQWQYWLRYGSLKKERKKRNNNDVVGSAGVLVAGALKWVAVVCCSWYSWIEEMNAVILRLVRM
jgi:hypothetical protein